MLSNRTLQILFSIMQLLSTIHAEPNLLSLLYPPQNTSIFTFSPFARQMKSYSGRKIGNDTNLMIYFNEQTIAIVELGLENIIFSCELIEIINENDGNKLLDELSQINQPLNITFNQMLHLMEQCETIDERRAIIKARQISYDGPEQVSGRNLFVNQLTFLRGVVPGTKWCGNGDIAQTYNDLGTEDMDRCCRTHDICPMKIRAFQKRYNLTNNSFYTKSHCACDDLLFKCLKKTKNNAAQVIGSIYFNLLQVPCIDDSAGFKFRKAREGF